MSDTCRTDCHMCQTDWRARERNLNILNNIIIQIFVIINDDDDCHNCHNNYKRTECEPSQLVAAEGICGSQCSQ